MITRTRFPFVYRGRKRYYFPFIGEDGRKVRRFPWNQPDEDEIPENALTLHGEPLMLDGKYLVLGG